MTEIEIKGQKYAIHEIDTMYWVCPDGTKIPIPPSGMVVSFGEDKSEGKDNYDEEGLA